MKEEYKGYTITIEQDADYTDSPVDWTTPEERGATFALYHRRYTLPMEVEADFDDYNSWTEFAEANKPDGQPVYKFVEWYEHSGVVVYLKDYEEGSRPFDSGTAGVIFGTDEAAIEDAFATWKQYTEGDIWSVTVTDRDDEYVDSLSGIYGYDQAEQEGIAIVEYALSRPRVGHKPMSAGRLHV